MQDVDVASTSHYSSIVAIVIAVGNNILHCVSGVMTVVNTDLQISHFVNENQIQSTITYLSCRTGSPSSVRLS